MGCTTSSEDVTVDGSRVVIDAFRNPLSDPSTDLAGTTAAVSRRNKQQQQKHKSTSPARAAKHRRTTPPHPAGITREGYGRPITPIVAASKDEQSRLCGPTDPLMHGPHECADPEAEDKKSNASRTHSAKFPPSPQASAQQHQHQHHARWRDRAPSVLLSSAYWGVPSSPGVNSSAGSAGTTTADYRKWTRSSRASSITAAGASAPHRSPAAAPTATSTITGGIDEGVDPFAELDPDGADARGWAPHSRSGSVVVALSASMIDEPLHVAASPRMPTALPVTTRTGATVVASP